MVAPVVNQTDRPLSPKSVPSEKITVGYVVGLVSGLRTGQRPVCSTSEQFGIGGLVDAAIGAQATRISQRQSKRFRQAGTGTDDHEWVHR